MRISLCILGLFSFYFCYGQEQGDWTDYIELYNEKTINTEGTEFGTSYWNDKIVFVKNRTRQPILDKKTNEPYFDLHFSRLSKANSMMASEPLSNVINTDYHEGPSTFRSDGKKIYFTRVDYEKGTFNLNDKKSVVLKIFESEFKNGNWSSPIKTDINQENRASAHPALSRNNEYLIFASDRPEGYGKMDLYISYQVNGHWTNPTNMGPEINTSGNEWFPYLNERNYLFFSSDGLGNRSDMDIYVSESINDKWTNPIPLPSPINGRYDDFGFITNANAISGYLSSNRPGGVGKDDIYSFNSLVSLFAYSDKNYNKVNFIVSDHNTGLPIGSLTIRYKYLAEKNFDSFNKDIFDLNYSTEHQSVITDKNGKAQIKLQEGYSLVDISYPGKKKWQLVMSNQGAKKNIDIALKDEVVVKEPEPKIVYIEKEVPEKEVINNVKVDVGAVIVFDNIYYDYNSSELTRGAMTELDGLAEIMLKNNMLKIQLSAHTDSRGNAAYNTELSQKRAQSAKAYLVSKGIRSDNVVALGYGESQLRNHCTDDIFCTEAEHIYNRRTEVKILQK